MKYFSPLLCMMMNVTIFAFSSSLYAKTICLQPQLDSDFSKTEVYQLKNGLTVYLSQNKLSPQIAAKIAVRAGAIDEPMDKTGMAHYLEHLMFKGTTQIGTTNYEEEKVILGKIEALYTQHEKEVDSQKRTELYKKIADLSLQANEYMVANEYDRFLAKCGASGVNAYTSTDCTVYESVIPNVQLENYLTLEYERFKAPVFRGFYSELETVFEEWNMGQDDPRRILSFQFMKSLYPNTRLEIPVIGTAEALHNPSPKRVMDFYKAYYVPSNMCIALSGDLDTNLTLKMIEKTFGLFPSQKAPVRPPLTLPEIDTQKIFNLVTKQVPSVAIFWRFPCSRKDFGPVSYMVSSLLQDNGAGVLEKELVSTHKVANISVSSFFDFGYAYFSISATPLVDSSAKDAFVLLDEALNKVKSNLADTVKMKAICTQIKLSLIQRNYQNGARIAQMVDAFINKDQWSNIVDEYGKMNALTPKDVNLFVANYLNDSRYVLLFEKGEYPQSEKLEKPPVTPMKMNRNAHSNYELPCDDVAELEAIYPNVEKEMVGFGTQFEFAPNTMDETFSLQIVFPYGKTHNSYISLLTAYLNKVGSKKHSYDALKAKLYELGGNYNFSSNQEETVLTVSGLYENSDSILALGLEVLFEPLKDDQIAKSLGKEVIRGRELLPTQPMALVTTAVLDFVKYGPENYLTSQLTDAQLTALNAEILLNQKSKIFVSDVLIRMYAPDSKLVQGQTDLASLQAFVPKSYQPKKLFDFDRKPILNSKVYLINIPKMQQAHILRYIRTAPYCANDLGLIDVFNQYYGQSMSSVTFQSLREAQSLCYYCTSSYILPEKPNTYCGFITYLSTQNAKVGQAIKAAVNLGFPVNENRIQEVKNNILRTRATERTLGAGILGHASYLKRYQLPINQSALFDQQVRDVTGDMLRQFYNDNIANKPAEYFIIGDMSQIDASVLKKYGQIEALPLDSIMPPKE